MRLVLMNMEIEVLDSLLMDAARVSFNSSHPDAYKVRKRINDFVEKIREETTCAPQQSISLYSHPLSLSD